MGPIKTSHSHIDPADLLERMSIGAGSRRDPKRASQLVSPLVNLGLRPTVEDLDDVNLSCNPLNRLFAQIAPARVVRVFQVDQSSLALDRVDRVFWRQPTGNRLLEKQANQFAFSGEDLLADDRGLAGLEEQLGAVDAFVVREEDGGEPQLAAAASNLERWNPTIKGSSAVNVQVHAD